MSSHVMSMGPGPGPLLPQRQLRSYHIFFIGISGTIGVGFFDSAGEILGIAGPGGALLAFGIVGFVACMVMEGICEMLVHWAIPNPMVEFVRVFVDRDLAIVVGFAYWYTYAITFTALIIATGSLVNYWGLSFAWKSAIFIILPLVLVLFNSRSVLFFGNLELAGGFLKLVLVLGLFILMMLLDQGVGPGDRIGATFFDDGVRNNPYVADTHFKACLVGISLAVFPFLGVESITVTAFEALNPQQSLRFAAKNIAYFVTVVYFLSVLGFVYNVEWFNRSLQPYFEQPLVAIGNATVLGHNPVFVYNKFRNALPTQSLPVIAIIQAGMTSIPGFVQACLAYSALSAANTALYIASRTMYGLAQSLDPDSGSPVNRLLSRIGTVTPTTRVPGWAILLSCMFLWLPFLHLGSGVTRNELQEILISVGSTSCVLVWASQCLAFIRYHSWRKMHKENLRDEFEKYHPNQHAGFSSWFAFLQPLPAWIGLIGCIIIVLVFASVGMWNGKKLLLKALTIYLGPVILLCVFITLKLINRRRWVSLGDWADLRQVLIGLESRQVQPSKYVPVDHAVRDDASSGHFSTHGDDFAAAESGYGLDTAEVQQQFNRFAQQDGRFDSMVSPPPPAAAASPEQSYALVNLDSGSPSRGSSGNSGQRDHSRDEPASGYASDGSRQFLRPNYRAQQFQSEMEGGQRHAPAYGHDRGPSVGSSELGIPYGPGDIGS